MRKRLIYFSLCLWLCGFISVSLRGGICFLATSLESRTDRGSLQCHPSIHLCQWNKDCLCFSPSESREQTFLSTGNRPLNPFQYCHWNWYTSKWKVREKRKKKIKLELDWSGIIKAKWNALFWFEFRMMLHDLANYILFFPCTEDLLDKSCLFLSVNH